MSERKSEIRELGEFDRIAMRGIGKLSIQQGDVQEVMIEGGENAVSRITTNVVDRKLIIDIGRDWVEKLSAGLDFLSSQDIQLSISVKALKELEITGAADIEAVDIKGEAFNLKMIGASNVKLSNLKVDDLKTEMPGAGKITVDGKVINQTVTLTGAGNFSGHNLESKTAKVILSGVGSAQLWVTDELDVTIAGVGSVEYYGSPAIKQSVTMVGKVTSLGSHE